MVSPDDQSGISFANEEALKIFKVKNEKEIDQRLTEYHR